MRSAGAPRLASEGSVPRAPNRRAMRALSVWCIGAALCMADPAAAQDAPGARPGGPSSPVTISACSGGITSIEFVEIAAYDVTFRNTAPVAADEVRFSARYGRHQKRAAFDLKGTFAPGAVVSRHVRRTVSGGLFSYQSDRNDCDVDYVHFTNGSSWSRL